MRLNRIKCPITVLHGEKDLVAPLAWCEKMCERFGEKVKKVTFPNAGHSPITDVPKDFFRELKAALA